MLYHVMPIQGHACRVWAARLAALEALLAGGVPEDEGAVAPSGHERVRVHRVEVQP